MEVRDSEERVPVVKLPEANTFLRVTGLGRVG